MQTEIRSLFGCDVIDADGRHVGKVGQVFLSDRTGEPEWVTVRTGMFGMKQTFVPLIGARRSGDELRVPFGKETIKDAPNVDVDDDRLTLEEEAGLYRYYGLRPSGVPSQRTPGDAETGDNLDMTRSEERMRVGKETREAGHVRLRKYVETEQVQEEIPLEHDEVVIEREPISEGMPLGGGEFEDDEESITLYEERPVVGKETRPVERVRVHKERVREDETVRGDVRRERFEVDSEGTVVDEEDEHRS